ncbi:MAG: FUSC family protein, partial [Actinobacteria bacterium]|nr:FUSC family protein [Actinomycetota bacterium]
DAPEQWPEQGRRLRAAAASVLRASGDALDYPAAGPDPLTCGSLDACLAQLEITRRGVARETLRALRVDADVSLVGADGPVRGEFERPLYAAHELGYVVALAGRTVALIAVADGRSWWAKVTGRRVTTDELGTTEVVRRSTRSHLDRHSVWLQNSVRAAAGLALAVLLARLFSAQNAFWIGLGALSVLRSNALSTGATVARALAGTVVGFAVGGAIVAGLGTSHAVLWPLLPAAILVAAFAPAVISFVAGQAAFTVVTMILFNIVAPAGWRVGVLRVEDVALGCAASFGAGLLFWPRGAGTALGLALGDAYRSSADYLRAAVAHLAGRTGVPAELGAAAMAAGRRLDDALRQYLAERGAKHVPLASVVALANGAARVRLAGTAIKHLHVDASDDHAVHDELAGPAELLARRADLVGDWYAELAR